MTKIQETKEPKKNASKKTSKIDWRKPTYEEFKFSGCDLNGPSAS